MTLKLNGTTSGSVSLDAPATGSDVSLTLPTVGFGKVLQVVQSSITTMATIASTSFTDTNVTASITPSSSTSKVLVIVDQAIQVTRSTSVMGASVKLVRGSTDIYTADGSNGTAGFYLDLPSITSINFNVRHPYVYLDSPATTSSTTYKTQARAFSTANSGTVYCQNGATSTITLIEIAA